MMNHRTNRSSFFGFRGLIYVCQIFGMFFALISLAVYINYFGSISNGIGGDQAQGRALAAMILGFLTYLGWKTIYSGIVIIRFVKNSSDEDVLANRFVLAALSLNLGGFMTPFILTAMPNIPVRSSINPRWFLSRTMGVISVVGAPVSLLVFFLAALTGDNALTMEALFDKNLGANGIAIGMLLGQILVTCFGAITVSFFYQKTAQDTFSGQKNGIRTFMRIIATIWLIVTTIELFFVLFFAIMRIFGALADVLNATSNRSGPLILLWLVMRFFMTVIMMGYYIFTINKTMVGIWSEEGITYGHYEGYAKLDKMERSNERNR